MTTVERTSSPLPAIALQNLPPAMRTRAEAAIAVAVERTSARVASSSTPSSMTAPQLESAMALILDPMAMLTGIQAEVRESQNNSAMVGARGASDRAEEAAERLAEITKKALDAARKATRGMPKWVKGIVSGVIAAVGAVASVVTGGASVALAAVGIALLLGGEIIGALGEAGIIDPNKAQWISLALKVAGSAIMAVAGGVGELAKNVSELAQTIGTAVKVAVAVSQTVDGVVEMNKAVLNHEAQTLTIEAGEQQLVIDLALEDMGEETETAKEVTERFSRAMDRILATLRARDDAMNAAIHAPA